MYVNPPWRRVAPTVRPRVGWRPLAFALLIGLTGCTYVTKAQQDAKFACLDEDGDGAVKQDTCADPPGGVLVVDCDDDNGDRFPGNEEIAYDGIDQDCDGFDLLDVDDDGFPGILEADWQSNDGAVTWPSTLDPRLDCNDADPDVYPESEAELAYDGIDSDCAGDDDYDADRDGYVIRADLLPPGAPPYTGDLPGGDCDDNDPTINPGVGFFDIPYDGIDSNCDGANDFDADGDTWMPDGYQLEFQAFVEQYGQTFPANFGDCDDADPLIYPDAPDTWYDGIDSDCAGDDDYDADGDGYVLREDLRPPGTPPYTGALLGGDCDDQDGLVFPGALETLGDAVDSDCDGGPDTTPFGFSDAGWLQPRPPVVGATDFHYLLTTATDTFDNGTARNNVGVTLLFDRTGLDPEPSVFRWESVVPMPFAEQLDAIYGTDQFWIAAAHQRRVGQDTRNDFRLYRMVWNADAQQYVRSLTSSQNSTTDEPYLGLDLEPAADGSMVAAACAPGTLHVSRSYLYVVGINEQWTDGGEVIAAFDPVTGPPPGRVGSACLVTPDDDAVVALNDLEASGFAFDLQNGTATYTGTDAALSPYTVNRIVHRGPLLVLSGTSPGTDPPTGVTVLEDGAVVGRYLEDDVVLHADAALVSSTLYLVAVVEDRDGDGLDEALLLYGDPAGPTEVALPFTHPDRPVSPTGASVFADTGRVFVAVVGIDARPTPGTNTDVVGWAFYMP